MIEDRLKKYKEEMPVPEELNKLVNGTVRKENRRRMIRGGLATSGSVFALFAVTVLLTINPVMAETLQQLPFIGPIYEVVAIHKEYDDGMAESSIQTPQIMTNEQDEEVVEMVSSLNKKYLEESEALYEQFLTDIAAMDASGMEGHLGVDSGYEVLVDDERFLSVERYIVEMAASGATTMKYDTIDKENGYLLSLPAMFKDDRYIDVISQFIKSQMQERMQEDEGMIYWITDDDPEAFTTIDPQQQFYLNTDHQIVIVFDEYSVGPGVMGVQEFTIPTSTIKDLLVDSNYLDR